MERLPRYPQLDEINGREWIDTLSHQAGKRITLGHPPQSLKENGCGKLKL
jgi:hypothetical protein